MPTALTNQSMRMLGLQADGGTDTGDRRLEVWVGPLSARPDSPRVLSQTGTFDNDEVLTSRKTKE